MKFYHTFTVDTNRGHDVHVNCAVSEVIGVTSRAKYASIGAGQLPQVAVFLNTQFPVCTCMVFRVLLDLPLSVQDSFHKLQFFQMYSLQCTRSRFFIIHATFHVNGGLIAMGGKPTILGIAT